MNFFFFLLIIKFILSRELIDENILPVVLPSNITLSLKFDNFTVENYYRSYKIPKTNLKGDQWYKVMVHYLGSVTTS